MLDLETPQITSLVDNKDIVFYPETHTYVEKTTGRKLISVTTLIDKFKVPFDESGAIAARCAEREGIPVGELLAQWEKTKVDACERGIYFHDQMEHYIKTKEIKDGPDKDIVEKFAKIPFTGRLYSEQIVYSLEDGIAGTVDIVEVKDDNSITIWDAKTNKALKKFSPWKKRMLFPVSHLYECNFNAYQLQLNFYAHLLEGKGFWVDDMKILYINPKTRDIEVHDIKNEKRSRTVNILLSESAEDKKTRYK